MIKTDRGGLWPSFQTSTPFSPDTAAQQLYMCPTVEYCDLCPMMAWMCVRACVPHHALIVPTFHVTVLLTVCCIQVLYLKADFFSPSPFKIYSAHIMGLVGMGKKLFELFTPT